MVVDIKVKGERYLPKIRNGNGLASFALSVDQRGTDQSDEHADNGDDREEFNQSESPRSRRVFRRDFQMLFSRSRRNVDDSVPPDWQPESAPERPVSAIE